MSDLTEKTAFLLLKQTNARGVIVATFGQHGVPGDNAYTCKFHPLMERSIPSILRRMADDIEGKQDAKFKRIPRLVSTINGGR